MNIINQYSNIIAKLNKLDGIPTLFIRLYLAPVFIQAGWTKLSNFESTVGWFGNAQWGLGLPFPELLVALAAGAEFIGGFLILIGLGTRLVAIPLAVTMLVAATTVHLEHGWLAIADPQSWFADGTLFLNERVLEAQEKKQMAISILQEYGNYEWLTSSGSITILNNGVEFAATYLVMVIVLIFMGGGRYTSFDYYLARKLRMQA